MFRYSLVVLALIASFHIASASDDDGKTKDLEYKAVDPSLFEIGGIVPDSVLRIERSAARLIAIDGDNADRVRGYKIARDAVKLSAMLSELPIGDILYQYQIPGNPSNVSPSRQGLLVRNEIKRVAEMQKAHEIEVFGRPQKFNISVMRLQQNLPKRRPAPRMEE